MKKSVYSIVLMDDIVEAVDELAARQGMSRSAMINSILAGHLSCTTPEMQMQSVFSVLERQMNELFRIQTGASDAIMSMHSALRYKYRPALRYSVELLRAAEGDTVGWLRVSCRTKNTALLPAMDDFFRFIISLELVAEPDLSKQTGMYELAPGRMSRRILSRSHTAEEIGEGISLYVSQLDSMMQSYFSGLQDGIPVAVLRDKTRESLTRFMRQYGMVI